MRARIFTAMVVVASLFSGCYYDIVKPADTNKPPQNVSFSGDLQPIFTKSCATAGCHDGTAHLPTLTVGNSYTSIMSGGFVNTTIPTESILYKVVNGGEMPPTGAIAPSDVQKIYDWIRLGAPNN